MVRRNGIHLNPRTRVGRYPSGLIPYYAHFDLNITYIGANLYSLYLPTYVKVCSIYMHEQAYIIIADASSIVWDVARCVGCDKTGFLYNIRESADLFRHACFNPRTRVGCDHPRARDLIGLRIISIHAPAWGATAKVYKIICKKK